MGRPISSNGPARPKSFSLPDDKAHLMGKLKEIADRDRVTTSNLIVEAIETYVRQHYDTDNPQSRISKYADPHFCAITHPGDWYDRPGNALHALDQMKVPDAERYIAGISLVAQKGRELINKKRKNGASCKLCRSGKHNTCTNVECMCKCRSLIA